MNIIRFRVYGIGTELHPTWNIPIPKYIHVVFMIQFMLELADRGGRRGMNCWRLFLHRDSTTSFLVLQGLENGSSFLLFFIVGLDHLLDVAAFGDKLRVLELNLLDRKSVV